MSTHLKNKNKGMRVNGSYVGDGMKRKLSLFHL